MQINIILLQLLAVALASSSFPSVDEMEDQSLQLTKSEFEESEDSQYLVAQNHEESEDSQYPVPQNREESKDSQYLVTQNHGETDNAVLSVNAVYKNTKQPPPTSEEDEVVEGVEPTTEGAQQIEIDAKDEQASEVKEKDEQMDSVNGEQEKEKEAVKNQGSSWFSWLW